MKFSRAAKTAITAFRGLQSVEEEHVLRELGLIRDPSSAKRADDRQVALMADAAAAIDLAEFDAGNGPSIGMPHPDQMTEEQRATYSTKRARLDDSQFMAKVARSSRGRAR